MSNANAVAVQKKQDIATVQQTLEKMKEQLAMALPAHIKPERMIRVALTAIQNTPKLLECDKNSFYLAVLRAAQLGLEPDGILGQAYLIPYGDKVQLIPGYKGLIDLARRSGEVSNIIAKEVCQKDNFKIAWSQTPPFIHEQSPSGDRGEVIGFWALANFTTGGFHWDYMTKEEVLAIRDGSSGWKAAVAWSKSAKNKYTKGQIISPWEQNFIEMGKKTAIRRIAKFLPMSVQRASVVEDLVDSGKQFSADAFGEIVIDADQSDVIEGTAEETGNERVKAGKLDQFAGHDPETGEVIEDDSPSLQDWMDDIANVPTLEGLEHKFNQASELFGNARADLAQIENAYAKRKSALTPKAAPSPSGQPASPEPSQTNGTVPGFFRGGKPTDEA